YRAWIQSACIHVYCLGPVEGCGGGDYAAGRVGDHSGGSHRVEGLEPEPVPRRGRGVEARDVAAIERRDPGDLRVDLAGPGRVEELRRAGDPERERGGVLAAEAVADPQRPVAGEAHGPRGCTRQADPGRGDVAVGEAA